MCVCVMRMMYSSITCFLCNAHTQYTQCIHSRTTRDHYHTLKGSCKYKDIIMTICKGCGTKRLLKDLEKHQTRTFLLIFLSVVFINIIIIIILVLLWYHVLHIIITHYNSNNNDPYYNNNTNSLCETEKRGASQG